MPLKQYKVASSSDREDGNLANNFAGMIDEVVILHPLPDKTRPFSSLSGRSPIANIGSKAAEVLT